MLHSWKTDLSGGGYKCRKCETSIRNLEDVDILMSGQCMGQVYTPQKAVEIYLVVVSHPDGIDVHPFSTEEKAWNYAAKCAFGGGWKSISDLKFAQAYVEEWNFVQEQNANPTFISVECGVLDGECD